MSDKWNYIITKEFYNRNYSGLVLNEDLRELKNLKFKTGIDADGKPMIEQKQGWLAILNKKRFLLPQEINSIPIEKCIPLKISDFKQLIHSTNVYHIPAKIVEYRIRPERTLEFRDWFNQFVDFEHTNPMHWILYKSIILSGILLRVNFRLSTNPGFGKDSVPMILSNLLPFYVGIYTPRSAPKLLTMLEKKLLIIDEISDVDTEDSRKLEPLLIQIGDMRTKVNNSALSVAGQTLNEYDIEKLSVGFIYNDIDDYMPPHLERDCSHKYFDKLYRPPTRQRYVPFRLSGEINVAQFKRLVIDDNYEQYDAQIKKWIKMTLWLMESGFNELIKQRRHYKWINDKIIGTNTGRLNTNFHAILDFLRVLADDEKQFNMLADELYKSHVEYLTMLVPYEVA